MNWGVLFSVLGIIIAVMLWSTYVFKIYFKALDAYVLKKSDDYRPYSYKEAVRDLHGRSLIKRHFLLLVAPPFAGLATFHVFFLKAELWTVSLYGIVTCVMTIIMLRYSLNKADVTEFFNRFSNIQKPW